MNLETLLEKLNKTVLPIAFWAFESPWPDMPYAYYTTPECTQFYADNEVYCSATKIRITVCAKRKDLLLELKMRNALRGFTYRRSEEKNESENRYEYTYEMEIG